MGAAGIAAAALNTRTGRRIFGGAIVAIVLAVAVALTPLIAIPFAVAGSAAGGVPPGAAPPATSGTWSYPLAGEYTKGRGFGYDPVDGCSYCSTNHKGYDMAQGCGSTIFAAGPGDVITAGSYYGWGNTVRIDHGDALVTLYGHMQWESIRVTEGQMITAGTPLGAEGDTGASFGCHLHFEVQKSGTPVDPEPFMAALGLPLK